MTVSAKPNTAKDPSVGPVFSIPDAGHWDAPADGSLEHWTALASAACDMPMVCISLNGPLGSKVVASAGVDAAEWPAGAVLGTPALDLQGFCVVPDARLDPSVQLHPWVTGAPQVVFLASVALCGPLGQQVGTLSLMDSCTRAFSDREARILASMGQLITAHLTLAGRVRRTALQHQQLEQTHGWLLESASQDPLTQVANRRALMAFMDKTLALAHREAQPLAVLLLDVRGFKHVNEAYGDAVGDLVLAEVAARLSACARSSELVGRMAGDEFLAVLFPCTPEQASLAAERFAAAVHTAPIWVGSDKVEVSMAVGICAISPTELCGPEELYRRVAVALDSAKGLALAAA